MTENDVVGTDLLEYTSDLLTVVDRHGTIQYQSPAAEWVLGHDPASLVGEDVLEYVHADDRRKAVEWFETLPPREADGADPVDVRVRRDDGTWVWLEVVGAERPAADGGGYVLTGRDVSDRKETARALEKNEAALRRLHDVAADDDLGFEAKLARILDLGRERLDLALGFLTRIDGDVQVVVGARGDHELLQRGNSCPLSKAYCKRTIESDGLMTTRDPANEWVLEAAYDTFDLETYLGGKVVVDGRLYGTLCFADTERRDRPFRSDELAFIELLVEWVSYELERQTRERDLRAQNERLEAFASMVSHDLRNPLSVAAGNLEFARQGDDEAAVAIEESLDRMERLIDDMLWLAREGEDVGDRDRVHLGDAAEEAWQFVSTANASLTVVCDDPDTVHADRDRLLQLFENLFRNAVEHGSTSPSSTSAHENTVEHGARRASGSKAADTAGPAPIVSIRVGAIDDGFFVEDDGPGIPPEERDRVFEAGYSTEADGTGIGMSIVDRIADAHDWSVSISEGTLGGARFEFRPRDRDGTGPA